MTDSDKKFNPESSENSGKSSGKTVRIKRPGNISGKIKFDPQDPASIARAFIKYEADDGRPMCFWRGEMWVYHKPRYVAVNEIDGWMNHLKRWLVEGLKQNPMNTGENESNIAFSRTLLGDVLSVMASDQRLIVPDGNPPEASLFWIKPEARPEWWPEDNGSVTACGNGFIDMASGNFLEPTPDVFSLTDNEIVWTGKDTPADRFQKWLKSVQPSEEARQHLSWMAGYVISNRYGIAKVFYLYGEQRSGKGSFLRFLSKLVGKAGAGGTSLSSLNTEFGLANLSDKKLITLGDMRLPKGKTDLTTVTERILMITGGDSLPVRRMKRDPVYQRINAKIVASSNIILDLPDESATIADRFHTFEFSQSFANSVECNLDEEIWLAESSGILAWAVRGFNDFVAAGSRFPMNSGTLDMQESMAFAAEPFIEFQRECMVRVSAGSCGAEVDAIRMAYGQFLKACHENQGRPSANKLRSIMKSNRINVTRNREKKGGQEERMYRAEGWALNTEGIRYLEKHNQAAEYIENKMAMAKNHARRNGSGTVDF